MPKKTPTPLTEHQVAIVTKYGKFFENTGGNDPLELIQREDVSSFSNSFVFMMQTSCRDQMNLLCAIDRAGFLGSVGS